MKEILDNLKQSRRELGINYKKLKVSEINITNIKKVIERNETYDLTDKKLLENFETTPIYRYQVSKTGIIKENQVTVDEIVIALLQSQKYDGKQVECFMQGGNYKKVHFKDEEPVSITLIHSNLYHLVVEIQITQS